MRLARAVPACAMLSESVLKKRLAVIIFPDAPISCDRTSCRCRGRQELPGPLQSAGRAGADELGDLDAEAVFNDDDFAVRDQLVVDVETHRIAGVLVELDERTGCE